MTGIAYPFLRAPDACILAAPWVLLEDGVPVEIEDGLLPHFDYSTALSASRQVSLNFETLAEALKVEPKSLTLKLCVFAGTGGARLDRSRKLAFSSELTMDHATVPVEVEIQSRDVSGSVRLATELVLMSSEVGFSRLSPSRIGSRIWSDSFRVNVEPTQPRFPIEAVSFSRMLDDGPSDALWYLDWSPAGWDRDFRSAVRLYLNEDNPEFVEAVHEANETVIRMMMTAIALQMIRTALASEAFNAEDAAYPQGSVAAVVQVWIEQAFPGQSIEAVSTLVSHDPARFEAAVAAMTIEVDQDE
jgi:predicted secreted protein